MTDQVHLFFPVGCELLGLWFIAMILHELAGVVNRGLRTVFQPSRDVDVAEELQRSQR